MSNRQFLTRQANGSWAPATGTRIQQAKKAERSRIAKQIQLSKLQKDLAKQVTHCKHEIVYETPGIVTPSKHCVACGTVLPI